jgi:DNA-binding SARP family transcriptional activator
MPALTVSLFGRFAAESGSGQELALNGAKVRELFSYLLLNRDRPLLREKLATVLWADVPGPQSKGYLRKAVWQMQSALNEVDNPAGAANFLSVEAEWIQLNTGPPLWLDVAQFESAYKQVEDVSGKELSAGEATALMDAARRYRGDLLEGWYQDWCLFERERLERMYLNMLEKLVHYCAVHGKYEVGISYGMQALRLDRVRERTYRRLMQLHCFAGNRSEALHEYANCVDVLQKELGVQPSARTTALYQRIIAGELGQNGHKALLSAPVEPVAPPPQDQPLQLEEMWQLLAETQQLVQRNINAVVASIEGLRGRA